MNKFDWGEKPTKKPSTFQLCLRLVQLRNEYFNELEQHDLSRIVQVLGTDVEYTSNFLINAMKNYSDTFNKRQICKI